MGEKVLDVYLGVDVGINGALALLSSSKELLAVWDMPTEAKLGKGKKRCISAVQLAHLLRELNAQYSIKRVFVERVASMPSQGVASVFSFGESAGIVRGVIAGVGLPIVYVTPVSWKRYFTLTGLDKDAARTTVMSLYPMFKGLERKKDVDRADAALICLYGVEKKAV